MYNHKDIRKFTKFFDSFFADSSHFFHKFKKLFLTLRKNMLDSPHTARAVIYRSCCYYLEAPARPQHPGEARQGEHVGVQLGQARGRAQHQAVVPEPRATAPVQAPPPPHVLGATHTPPRPATHTTRSGPVLHTHTHTQTQHRVA